MRRSILLVATAWFAAASGAVLSSNAVTPRAMAQVQRPRPGDLAHTFSIVARDPETGEIGVAVQSHWFSVGTVVTWAEAGVGAVATQSFVQPSYGRDGLELMRKGTSAPDALYELLKADPARNVRQVAFVDAQGNAGVWTGSALHRFGRRNRRVEEERKKDRRRHGRRRDPCRPGLYRSSQHDAERQDLARNG